MNMHTARCMRLHRIGTPLVFEITQRDGTEFLDIAARIAICAHVETFALHDANSALSRLRAGQLDGAAVLIP